MNTLMPVKMTLLINTANAFLVRVSVSSLLLFLCVAGCGGPTTSVQGIVTYEGKPIARGVITVIPADGRGKGEGSKILDGAYEIKSIAPGSKQFSVMGYMNEAEETKVPSSSDEKIQYYVKQKGEAKPIEVPMDARGNNEAMEIKEGFQEINIELSKP